jgi:hypothetical protein
MNILTLIETAERNGRRDAGKYAFTAPDEIFTEKWTLTHKADEGRRYFVETDEAGVPFRCNCQASLKAWDATGEYICKHQFILAEELAIRETETAMEQAEDLYVKF